jgi:hypothetical protein
MKILLIVSLFSLHEIALAQYTSDTLILYTYSSGSAYKIKSERYTKTFNPFNQAIARKTEKWDGKRKLWYACTRDSFIYDNKRLLTREDIYLLDSQGNILRLFISQTNKYDSLGNYVERLQANNYFGIMSGNSFKSEYRFEDKRLLEERRLEWIFDKWMACIIKTYKYDSAGNLSSEIEKRRSINTFYPIPVNDNKTVYAYDSNGICKGSLSYQWDTIKKDWTPFLRKTCILNSSGKDSVCIYERRKLVSHGWDTNILENFVYDNNGRKILEKRQVMDKTRKHWIESSKSSWKYNDAGCILAFEWCDEWNIKIKSYAVRQLKEWHAPRNCSGAN